MTQEEFDEWYQQLEDDRYANYDAPSLGYVEDSGRIDEFYNEQWESLHWSERLRLSAKREPLQYGLYAVLALTIAVAILPGNVNA
jgi:hypothetical protein